MNKGKLINPVWDIISKHGDTNTNCQECVLKKEETCPYLEEMLNCCLFKDSEGRRECYPEKKHSNAEN